MENVEIVQLKLEDYEKCGNIWDMKLHSEDAERWRKEIEAGIRLVWVYLLNGEFVGEGSLVIQNDDPDYTMPGKRIYFSRLIVKKELRGQGIGSTLVDHLLKQARQMEYREISIGVDKSNTVALDLYVKKGFTKIIFDGEDEAGPYYKLLKKL